MTTPKFIVEGTDGEDIRPDAEGAPFWLFSPNMQDWLPESYPTREAAEAARVRVEALSYYAVVKFGHVDLYRLEAVNETRPPVATFTSVAEFEAFTGVGLAAFNGGSEPIELSPAEIDRATGGLGTPDFGDR